MTTTRRELLGAGAATAAAGVSSTNLCKAGASFPDRSWRPAASVKQPLTQRMRPLLPLNRPPRASPARRAPSGPACAPGSLLEES